MISGFDLAASPYPYKHTFHVGVWFNDPNDAVACFDATKPTHSMANTRLAFGDDKFAGRHQRARTFVYESEHFNGACDLQSMTIRIALKRGEIWRRRADSNR